MNVIIPGYSYELETTDTITYPSGYQPFDFDNPIAITPGIKNSLEVIEMMIDRYLYFAEHNIDGDEQCSISYRLAAKAEKIVKSYIDNVETS